MSERLKRLIRRYKEENDIPDWMMLAWIGCLEQVYWNKTGVNL